MSGSFCVALIDRLTFHFRAIWGNDDNLDPCDQTEFAVVLNMEYADGAIAGGVTRPFPFPLFCTSVIVSLCGAPIALDC